MESMWNNSGIHVEYTIPWLFHMESKVIVEPENSWDLSQKSFHMDSMEWLMESMIPYGFHMD
jgi:hypothetical protein